MPFSKYALYIPALLFLMSSANGAFSESLQTPGNGQAGAAGWKYGDILGVPGGEADTNSHSVAQERENQQNAYWFVPGLYETDRAGAPHHIGVKGEEAVRNPSVREDLGFSVPVIDDTAPQVTGRVSGSDPDPRFAWSGDDFAQTGSTGPAKWAEGDRYGVSDASRPSNPPEATQDDYRAGSSGDTSHLPWLGHDTTTHTYAHGAAYEPDGTRAHRRAVEDSRRIITRTIDPGYSEEAQQHFLGYEGGTPETAKQMAEYGFAYKNDGMANKYGAPDVAGTEQPRSYDAPPPPGASADIKALGRADIQGYKIQPSSYEVSSGKEVYPGELIRGFGGANASQGSARTDVEPLLDIPGGSQTVPQERSERDADTRRLYLRADDSAQVLAELARRARLDQKKNPSASAPDAASQLSPGGEFLREDQGGFWMVAPLEADKPAALARHASAHVDSAQSGLTPIERKYTDWAAMDRMTAGDAPTQSQMDHERTRLGFVAEGNMGGSDSPGPVSPGNDTARLYGVPYYGWGETAPPAPGYDSPYYVGPYGARSGVRNPASTYSPPQENTQRGEPLTKTALKPGDAEAGGLYGGVLVGGEGAYWDAVQEFPRDEPPANKDDGQQTPSPAWTVYGVELTKNGPEAYKASFTHRRVVVPESWEHIVQSQQAGEGSAQQVVPEAEKPNLAFQRDGQNNPVAEDYARYPSGAGVYAPLYGTGELVAGIDLDSPEGGAK